jgi:hypothetical protein
MQKACTMLASEMNETAETESGAAVIEFPVQRRWSFGPMLAGLAAAAAVAIVFIDLRGPGSVRSNPLAVAAPATPRATSVAVAVNSQDSSDAMKPVFLIGRSSAPSAPNREGTFLLNSIDTSSQVAQLNWIGDVHLTPVFSSTGRDFLLNPKTDLKAAVISDPQGNHDLQEPTEMAAFRFQR